VPPSATDVPPQFQIHSELGALPHEFLEDSFDLRSVSTQREPLASRKPMESADWLSVHEPVSARRDSSVPSERTSHNPSSSSAITILVDSGRISVASIRDSIPSALPVPPQRASVPLSWVVGAAAFALALAFLVAWVMRAPTPTAATEHSAALGTALPSIQAALPAPKVPPEAQGDRAPASAALPASASALLKAVPSTSVPHAAVVEVAPSVAASAKPALAVPAHSGDLHAASPPAAEATTKPRQSIY
jgi:hypothetical protein